MAWSKKYKKIREYYSEQTISEKIKNITPSGSDKGDAYATSIYNKYNISQFANKGEYELAVERQTRANVIHDNKDEIRKLRKNRKDVNGFIDNLVKDKIDAAWRDYEHRDALIRSGQYDTFRIYDYRDKYIENMKAWGIDEKIINDIENATREQLERLFSMRDAEKDSPNKYKLPVLGFYYGELQGQQLEEVESTITEAIRAAKINVEEPEYEEPKYDYSYSYYETEEQTRVRGKYGLKTYSMSRKSGARNATRRLGARYRPENNNLDALYSNMELAYLRDDLNVITTKKGYKYIPFVGSTNPKSKNAAFMRGLVEHAAAFGVNFDK